MKTDLKQALVKLIDDYITLKQQMRNMYNQAHLTQNEALALEAQGLEMEQQLDSLHSSLKTLDVKRAAGGKDNA